MNCTSENTLGFMVEPQFIDAVLDGTAKNYFLLLDEDNYQEVIEHIDGNIVLVSDDLTEDFSGCYMWNNGHFPFMLRTRLKHLMFSDGKRTCPVYIKYIKTKVHQRISFDENDESVEDPNGNFCIWKIDYHFTLTEPAPLPDEE